MDEHFLKTKTGKSRLMFIIARCIGTRKDFILLDTVESIEDNRLLLRVIMKGGFVYRFIVYNFSVEKVWREVVS